MADLDLVFQPPAANNSDFLGMLNYINNLTDVGHGGMFWTVMLIVFGGILFLMMKSFSTERAFGITSIIVCVVAWLFRILGWINNYTITVSTILMIFGIYLLVKEAAPFEQ